MHPNLDFPFPLKVLIKKTPVALAVNYTLWCNSMSLEENKNKTKMNTCSTEDFATAI